jgi:hypothetical protein
VVDIIVKVLDPATNKDLLTLDEAKTMLGITTSTPALDAELQAQITVFSDVIATTCNRTFAKETVRETIRELQPNRYFLTHYPIEDETDITSVQTPRGSTVDPSTYEIELASGKVELITSGQSEPIVIEYTGGYDLPDEAPPALKQCCLMAIREERMLSLRSDTAGIRAMTHKESRVVFYDPLAILNRPGGAFGTMLGAANNLLMHYVRIQV